MTRFGTHAARSGATGAAMVVASASIWPFMDAIARHLGESDVPATQIAWGRYVGTGVILLPVVLARGGRRALLPRREPLHLLRAAIPALIAAAFFLGLRFLPFASASALLFTNPLFITAFSAFFLGERVGPRRWAAVAAGFAGVLLVLRPGVGVFQAGALLPIVAAVGFAAVAVMNRKLAGHTPATATTLHYSIAGAVLLAQASVLAPFHYVELAAAVVIGLAIFGEKPDAAAVAGIALILLGGLAVSSSRARESPPVRPEETQAPS